MLRSAAKNHESVTVIVDPADYGEVAAQVEKTGGTTPELRRRLAGRVFARTAAYDGHIAKYFARLGAGAGALDASPPAAGEALPTALAVNAPLAQPLRYGENPHQRAALYGRFGEFFKQLHGKDLSYNNILELKAADRKS